MELLTRIVRELNRYGAPCVVSLLSAFQKAARFYAPRPEETVGTDRQRHFGSRVWEGRRRPPRGNAHPALAMRLLAVFAVCAAAGSAVLLTVDETTTASSPGNSAEAGVRAGIDAHPLQSYEGPPTATSGLSLPAAISGARRTDSGPESLARARLPAHVMPASEPPELLAPLDVPLAPEERRASAIPVLAAILPAAAEINRGLQLALSARPLNSAPARPTPLLKSADWRSRTAPSDERGPRRAPLNPLLAAVQPGSAAAPGPAWGSVPLVNRTALQAPHAGRPGRNPASGPERNAVARVPPVATLTAVHPNRMNISPEPLDESGASVLNSSSPIRAPDGFPGDPDRRIPRPDGPASVPRLQEPLLVAIRPNQIEVGHRQLDAIGASVLNSSSPIRAPDGFPGDPGRRIPRPDGPASVPRLQEPLLVAIRPNQIEVGHRQLDAIGASVLNSSSPIRAPDGFPGDPGRRIPRPDGPASVPRLQEPLLVAIRPNQIEVGHRQLDAIGASVLNSSSPIRAPDGFPGDPGQRIRRPDGPASVPRLQEPLLVAIRPNQIEVGHRQLDAIGASVLNSSSPIRAPDGFPGDPGRRIPRPDGPASVPRLQEPLLRAIRPNQIEVGHRQLDAIGASVLNSSSPIRAPDGFPGDPGRRIPRPDGPASVPRLQEPLLVAIRPNQIEVGHWPLDAIGASVLNSSSPIRAPDGFPGDPGQRIPRPDGPASVPRLQEPLLVAIRPNQIEVGHRQLDAIGASVLNSSLPIRAPDGFPGDPGQRIPRPDGPASVPRLQEPLLVAIRPNQIEVGHRPLDAIGASVLNSSLPIRAPDGFPGDPGRRIPRPDGPASVPQLQEPLLRAIRPNQIEVGHRPLDAIGASVLNSSLPLSAMVAVPSEQGGQIAQPQTPASLLLPQDPLPAAIHPSQAQFSHKQLEVPASTPIAAPATQRVPQAHSDRRSWPGNEAPRELSSARWRPDALLAAVQPSNAAVRHEMQTEGDTGFLNFPPAPRPLMLATGQFLRGESQGPRDAVPLAPDPAMTANLPVAMQIDREAEIVPGTGPASAPAAPFDPLLSSPERRSHGNSPEPPSTAEAAPSMVVSAPAAFAGRHVQRIRVANAAVRAASSELPGALRAPLGMPENSLSQNVRSTVPEAVPERPGASPVQSPVAIALHELDPSPDPLLSSRLPALPAAYGPGDGAASETLEDGMEVGHESAHAPMLPLVRHTVEVAKGDSLLTILDTRAVPPSASLNAIARLRPRLNPKRIKAGDRVSFVLDELEGEIVVMELAVARIGGSERHHYWGSRTFEPREVVEFGNVGDDATEEGESEPAARESLAEDPSAGNAPVADAGEVPLFRHTMTVRPGDSLLGILQSNEVPAADALAAIRSVKPKFNPSRLQIGDRVSFVIDSPRKSDQEAAESRILEFSIAPDGESGAVHLWSSGENFSDRALLEIVDGIAGLEAPALAPAELILVEGRIAASFYRAAEQAGVSPGEIRELVRILSSRINFRRDIQKGDRFEALLHRQPGGPAKILFVALHNASRDHRYYRADFADGSSGYFDTEGHSSLNLISAEPIPGASISSRFGYRIHPVHRKRHFHPGLDFRAPHGAPIRAAGSGVVIVKGWRGGYGRYLRIRHNGSYTTAYAHLRGYAKDIKPGKHVKSGEIIGYVGSSGISTGPHLHFEVFEDGKAIDPQLLRNLPSPVLTGDLLTAFLYMREELDDTLDRLRIGSLASAD